MFADGRRIDSSPCHLQHYGFSEKIGLVAHSDEDLQYLSGARKDEIESETRRLIDEGWTRTVSLLRNNMDDLHTVRQAAQMPDSINLKFPLHSWRMPWSSMRH
jgi:ATP-dependent metalloprotease